MTAALRMEWLRLRTVRSTYWLLFAAALGTMAVGVTALAVYRNHVPRPGAAQMVNDGLSGVALGQLLVGFLGILVMTGEYSSGMIRATLAAVPDRKRVLAAKAAVFGGVGFVVTEAVCFGTFFASQAALSGSAVPRAGLGDPGVLRTVLFSGAYLTLIGLLGMGLGALVRHTGAAVGILFGLLFVPPFVLAILGPAGFQIARFTPLIILANSVGVVTPTQGCLSAWAGLGVIALYAAAALGLGAWSLTRRDA
jgi:ABC-type transport system involved in multi-copper enzyme maturation permease subunit